MRFSYRFLTLLTLAFASGCVSPGTMPDLTVDVLVLGGGTGGTAAGIAAARAGASTLLVEDTPWLGGMLTAAGVSATDGNHALPAGLWGAFREKLYAHYGGPEAVSTGWVSFTLFEPQVGARILQEMADAETNLQVRINSTWGKPARNGDAWEVSVHSPTGDIVVQARQLIDGTDLGDVAAAAGAAYDLGMDARADTGEPMAPEQANDIIQDFTYVAILKDYGEGTNRTIARPAGYEPGAFDCSCAANCPGDYDLPCSTMLEYGRLPNGYFMINWPNEGNDYYANMVEMNATERQQVYEEAKQHTRRFVYYIQHELGFQNLGLADDVFPTADSLPFIPYHREGRRIEGLVRLHVGHLSLPFDQEAPLYRTGIAVGDYPIDHHHDMKPEAPAIDFPRVPSFNIPAGALIPRDIPNLLIADKPISVTNIVNGSTRLQPVVLQIGQAAGTMAALAAREGVAPGDLPVRAVQQALLDENACLMPYYDVRPDHPNFQAIQRIGATGLLRGTGEPYQWANRTWFYPDAPLVDSAAYAYLPDYLPEWQAKPSGKLLSLEDGLPVIQQLCAKMPESEGHGQSVENLLNSIEILWREEGLGPFSLKDPLTRTQWAVLLDRLVDPFTHWPVDWEGRVR